MKVTLPNGEVVHKTRADRRACPKGSYERLRPSYEEIFGGKENAAGYPEDVSKKGDD